MMIGFDGDDPAAFGRRLNLRQHRGDRNDAQPGQREEGATANGSKIFVGSIHSKIASNCVDRESGALIERQKAARVTLILKFQSCRTEEGNVQRSTPNVQI